MAAYIPNSNTINKNDIHVQLAGSILRDEYDSINRKISNLQGAHLAVLRTLNPLPEDPPICHTGYGCVQSPSLNDEQMKFYELASIWLTCQNDAEGYCRKLKQAITALEEMRMDIAKCLASH